MPEMPERIPLLVEQLQSPAWNVRCQAARSLGENPTEEALDGLLQGLSHDPEPEVRRACAGALARMGPPAWDLLRHALQQAEEEAVTERRSRPPPQLRTEALLAPFAELLAAGDVADCLAVTQVLGHLRTPRFTSELRELLKHPDATVKAAALIALGQIHRGEERDRLWAFLGHREPTVRTAAVVGLRLFGVSWDEMRLWGLEKVAEAGGLDRSYLVHLIDHPDPSVRRRATEVLGRMREVAAGDLLSLLTHHDSCVRQTAENTLVHWGAEAVKPVQQALRSTIPDLRRRAARILGRLGQEEARRQQKLRDPTRQRQTAAVPFLDATSSPAAIHSLTQTLRQDEDDQVRSTAAWALGEIRHPMAVPALVEALGDDQNLALVNEIVAALQRIGPPALEALVQLLQHPDAQITLPVTRALGQLGEVAVDPLIEALGRQDTRTVDNARIALERMGPAVGESLVQRWEQATGPQRRQVLELLGKVGGSPTRTPLIQALASEDPETRCAAAKALGQIGDTYAVGPLIQTAEDPEPPVVHAAILALGQLADTTALGVLFRDLTASDPAEDPARRRDSDPDFRCQQAAQALRQANIQGSAQSSLQVLENPVVYVNQELQRERTLALSLRQLPTLHQVLFPEERQRLTAYIETGQPNLDLPDLTRSLLHRLGLDRHAQRGVRVDGVELRLLDAPLQVLQSMEWGADLDELYLWAGRALFRRNHPRALDVLIHALRHGSERVRWEAIETLGSTGHPRAVEPLMEVLSEADAGMQEAVLSALENLGTPRPSLGLQKAGLECPGL